MKLWAKCIRKQIKRKLHSISVPKLLWLRGSLRALVKSQLSSPAPDQPTEFPGKWPGDLYFTKHPCDVIWGIEDYRHENPCQLDIFKLHFYEPIPIGEACSTPSFLRDDRKMAPHGITKSLLIFLMRSCSQKIKLWSSLHVVLPEIESFVKSWYTWLIAYISKSKWEQEGNSYLPSTACQEIVNKMFYNMPLLQMLWRYISCCSFDYWANLEYFTY